MGSINGARIAVELKISFVSKFCFQWQSDVAFSVNVSRCRTEMMKLCMADATLRQICGASLMVPSVRSGETMQVTVRTRQQEMVMLLNKQSLLCRPTIVGGLIRAGFNWWEVWGPTYLAYPTMQHCWLVESSYDRSQLSSIFYCWAFHHPDSNLHTADRRPGPSK